MKLNQRLKKYRHQNKLSQQKVASYLGYKSFTTIQKWEDGTSQPSLDKLFALSELYHVDYHELLLGEPPVKNIMSLGTVRGGVPIYAVQEVINPNPDYFYLDVVGDSMIDARICEGDQILVKAQNKVENGQIGVVLIGDEATVKRIYYTEDGLRLKSHNPKYSDMLYTKEQLIEIPITILGLVIENRVKIK